MSTTSKVLAAIGGTILVIVLAVAAWQGGWWLKEESTNRTTGIANESLARQQARVDEVLDKAGTIAEIDVQIS